VLTYASKQLALKRALHEVGETCNGIGYLTDGCISQPCYSGISEVLAVIKHSVIFSATRSSPSGLHLLHRYRARLISHINGRICLGPEAFRRSAIGKLPPEGFPMNSCFELSQKLSRPILLSSTGLFAGTKT
jgi:hypothetical protein